MQYKSVFTFTSALLLVANVYALEPIHTGTVIVGSGISGLAAALDLNKYGQDVLVLEKMPFLGGTTNLAAQYFVSVNTREHQAAGKVLSVPDYLKRTEKSGRNAANLPRTAQRMYDSQKNVDWLNEKGVGLTRVISDYQLGISDGSSLGSKIMKVLAEKTKEAGIPIMTNAKVVNLIYKNGKVLGVEIEQKGGEKQEVLAKNVVLATGGFNNNQGLIAKYAPEWKGLPTTTAVSATGDGIVLAEKLKAAVKGASEVGLNPSIHSQDGINVSMSAARLEGGIMVNLAGKRFCDDYYPDYTKMARQMMAQPEGKSFVIIDDKSMKASKRLQGFLKKGYFVEAPTVAELARKIGVPEKNLEETLKTYEESVRKGKDEAFGRTLNMKTDFTHPPYYASSLLPGTQVSVGGLDVNDFMQCKTIDGKIIPNLYAVGELTYDSGTPHSLWTGRKAAEHILSK
ncbi:MAG: FAD-dependent oxidoreductase [Burkholderiales bacterium]|nr:FAD-dependent oxidoreductase [Burkholderiales bacterium]